MRQPYSCELRATEQGDGRASGQMAKLNCWEYKKCGRQPGGSKVAELGVCPAASEIRTNGINDGKNGGELAGPLLARFAAGKCKEVLPPN